MLVSRGDRRPDGPGVDGEGVHLLLPEGAAGPRAGLGEVRRRPAGRQRRRHAHQVPRGPLEFCFLADWFFRERGIRDDVDSPMSRRSTARSPSPLPQQHLGSMLAEKDIELITEFNTGEVDGVGGTPDRVRRS